MIMLLAIVMLGRVNVSGSISATSGIYDGQVLVEFRSKHADEFQVVSSYYINNAQGDVASAASLARLIGRQQPTSASANIPPAEAGPHLGNPKISIKHMYIEVFGGIISIFTSVFPA